MKKYILVAAVALSASLCAQNSMELYTLSRQAHTQGDTAGFLRYAGEAYAKAPFNLWFAANLAKAYALNGQKTKCIELLDDLAVLGFDFDVKKDEGFKKIWNHSLLESISSRVQKSAYKTVSTLSHTIGEKDLIPEGLAYNPRRNTFYLSSIYKRKIVLVHPDGGVRDVVAEKADGLLSTLGMKVDAARNHLWVLSALSSPHAKSHDAAEIGTSLVHQYELETMRLVAVYAPSDTLRHLFNDLAILSNGDVFLTDSETGAIYRIDAKARIMTKWCDTAEMIYPNGITLSPDQQYLFVAHWRGISRISIADTHSILLTAKVKTTMTGVDGLYFYDNALIAVQNGAGPQSRIMRFDLNKNYDSVLKATVLESAHPHHNIPTTGVIVGDDFYYIANSQLRSFDDSGTIYAPDRLQPVYILKLPLTPPQQ